MKYNKKLGSASQCIYHALYVAFFCSLLLIIIHSIVNGIYLTTINTLKKNFYDIRITLPLFPHDNFITIKEKIKNIKGIKHCVPLGIHYVLLSRDNNLKPLILLTADKNETYHLFHNNFYGNRVLYTSNIFSEDIPERTTIITANSAFNKKNNTMLCNAVSVVPYEKCSGDAYDNANFMVMDHTAFFNATEIIPFNTILIEVSDNSAYEKIIDECVEKLSIDKKNIVPWFAAYESTCKTLALEYWCSIIICALLFMLVSIVILSLVILFLKVQKRNIIGYVLIGVPINHIKIIISSIVSILLMISCFLGSGLGYFLAQFFHYKKIFSLYLYDVLIVVPFIPSYDIMLMIVIIIMVLSFIISYYYVQKIYDQRSLIINE